MQRKENRRRYVIIDEIEYTALKEGTSLSWNVYADSLEEKGNKRHRISRAIANIPGLERCMLNLACIHYNTYTHTYEILYVWDKAWANGKGCRISDYKTWRNSLGKGVERWSGHVPHYSTLCKCFWALCKPEDVPGMLEENPYLVWQFYLRLLAIHRKERRQLATHFQSM